MKIVKTQKQAFKELETLELEDIVNIINNTKINQWNILDVTLLEDYDTSEINKQDLFITLRDFILNIVEDVYIYTDYYDNVHLFKTEKETKAQILDDLEDDLLVYDVVDLDNLIYNINKFEDEFY